MRVCQQITRNFLGIAGRSASLCDLNYSTTAVIEAAMELQENKLFAGS
jgi:hypothetical protein